MLAYYFFLFFLIVSFFCLVRLVIFGTNLKLTLNYLLEKNINLICFFSFLAFILLKFYLGFNVISLKSKDIIVSTTLENVKYEVSGHVL